MTGPIVSRDDGVLLRVRAQPNAKQTKIIGLLGDQLKIAIAAPPVDERANDSLIEFLRLQLGVKSGQIVMIAGAGSRSKTILVRDLSIDEVRSRLNLA